MTATEIREIPVGERSLWEAFHVPTQSRIGVCFSKAGAEDLIEAGAMFLSWDTLTAEEAKAIKGAAEMLEAYAGFRGLAKCIVTDDGKAMWFTESDLKLLDEVSRHGQVKD